MTVILIFFFNFFIQTKIKTSLADVKGIDEVKYEIEQLIRIIKNPEKYKNAGAKLPKGILLVGKPGTGKTLIARALASNIEAKFLKVVASAIVDKYIGESARVIREMFAFAK